MIKQKFVVIDMKKSRSLQNVLRQSFLCLFNEGSNPGSRTEKRKIKRVC